MFFVDILVADNVFAPLLGKVKKRSMVSSQCQSTRHFPPLFESKIPNVFIFSVQLIFGPAFLYLYSNNIKTLCTGSPSLVGPRAAQRSPSGVLGHRQMNEPPKNRHQIKIPIPKAGVVEVEMEVAGVTV